MKGTYIKFIDPLIIAIWLYRQTDKLSEIELVNFFLIVKNYD